MSIQRDQMTAALVCLLKVHRFSALMANFVMIFETPKKHLTDGIKCGSYRLLSDEQRYSTAICLNQKYTAPYMGKPKQLPQ